MDPNEFLRRTRGNSLAILHANDEILAHIQQIKKKEASIFTELKFIENVLKLLYQIEEGMPKVLQTNYRKSFSLKGINPYEGLGDQHIKEYNTMLRKLGNCKELLAKHTQYVMRMIYDELRLIGTEQKELRQAEEKLKNKSK